MKKFISVILVIFLTQSVYAADEIISDRKLSKKLLSEARSVNSKVVKLKNEWRGTRKLIKQANKAHNKKDYKKAIGFSKRALNEAKMALEQHKGQKDNYRFFE
jgi:hypothetical protein